MASEGPNSPSSATGTSWTTPENVYSSNDIYASILGQEYLYITGFGFSLPATIEIVGLVAEIEAHTADTNAYWIAILRYNGTNLGTQKNTAGNPIPASDSYQTLGSSTDLWDATLTKTILEDATFGIAIIPQSVTETIYVDHVRITIYYNLSVDKSFTADTISSITESFSVTKQSFDISVANNLTAYVMNKNKGWSKITNAPYTSMIYRPSLQELWATRRNAGQICKVNSGTTFDGNPINAILQTGYFDFGQFDEIQAMEGKMASAIKRLRALHSEIKSEGNLTLTVYTENDSTGQSFTITPTTTDNIVYNMVRTALSRDIKGKFVSFKIANASGQDFFVGKLALRIIPKGLR